MLIDSHAHISYFEKHEQLSVIQSAFKNGVKIINNISTEVQKFDEILASCHDFPNIYCTIGTHPCHVQDEPNVNRHLLLELINKHKQIIGIGETGLDFFHDETHKELQIHQFWEHIFAAATVKKPIIVHTRNADVETLEVLSSAKKQFGDNLKILIHCFTGSEDFCKKLLDIDSYISFSGIVTFKNAKSIQNAMLATPENRIMIETDSPFLAPEPMRGQKNQPAFVKHVAEKVANLRGIPTESLIEITGRNFCKLFDVKA